jgi:hypothetical protein
MSKPWDVRPRQTPGDPHPGDIFHNVGLALNEWEALESRMAELFDALVSNAHSPLQSNRAAFSAFTAVSSSSARTQLVNAAAPMALAKQPDLLAKVSDFLSRVSHFGARRNEIAHGLTVNLSEFGFYLAPNNVMPHKWAKTGEAKFQYVAADVHYYAEHFYALRQECEQLTAAVFDAHSNPPEGAA